MSWPLKARNARWPHLTDAEYLERYKARIKVDENGCWLFQLFIKPTTGYGDLSYRGKVYRAHRAMYIVAKGPIPDGLHVLHSCDVRHCLNPDHLRLGTVSDNKQDEIQRGRNWELSKEFCTRGHSYAEHGVRHGENQWRQCKICIRGRSRVKAGWPEDLAYSLDRTPNGYSPVGGKWKREQSERS